MYHDDQNIREVLEDFYSTRNYGKEGGYYKDWVWFQLGFIKIPLPNTRQRKENIFRHDLNHIITGYTTTYKGEFLITAWEMGSGGWGKYWFINFITLQAMGIGLLLFPKSTTQAFRQGLNMNNTYTTGLSRSEIMNMTIGQLREKFHRKEKHKRSLPALGLLGIFYALSPAIIFGIVLTIFFYL